jgi:hypothetical protein
MHTKTGEAIGQFADLYFNLVLGLLLVRTVIGRRPFVEMIWLGISCCVVIVSHIFVFANNQCKFFDLIDTGQCVPFSNPIPANDRIQLMTFVLLTALLIAMTARMLYRYGRRDIVVERLCDESKRFGLLDAGTLSEVVDLGRQSESGDDKKLVITALGKLNDAMHHEIHEFNNHDGIKRVLKGVVDVVTNVTDPGDANNYIDAMRQLSKTVDKKMLQDNQVLVEQLTVIVESARNVFRDDAYMRQVVGAALSLAEKIANEQTAIRAHVSALLLDLAIMTGDGAQFGQTRQCIDLLKLYTNNGVEFSHVALVCAWAYVWYAARRRTVFGMAAFAKRYTASMCATLLEVARGNPIYATLSDAQKIAHIADEAKRAYTSRGRFEIVECLDAFKQSKYCR